MDKNEIAFSLAEKISDVRSDVSEIRGMIEGRLPLLATREEIVNQITDRLSSHVDDFHKGQGSLSKKQIAAIVGAITALVSALTAAINHFIGT